MRGRGLGLGLGCRRAPRGTSIDPAAQAYFDLVVAEGGSLNVAKRTAIATWFDVSSYYRAKIPRANFFCTDGFNGLMVPIVNNAGGALDVNHNFVSGDYDPIEGLTGDAALSKYLETGLALGPSIDGAGIHAYRLGPSTVAEESERLIGAYGLADDRADLAIYTSANVYSGFIGGPSTGGSFANVLAPASPQFLSLARMSPTVSRTFTNGVQEIESVATPFLDSTGPLFVFAQNTQGNPTNFTSSTLGAYLITDGMTNGEIADMYTDLYALMDALDRV